MAIPSLFDLTLPILRFVRDGRVVPKGEVISHLSEEFEMSDDEKSQLLASGVETLLENRYNWATVELVGAGLIRRTKPSHIQITESGSSILETQPASLRRTELMQIEAYRKWVSKKADLPDQPIEDEDQEDEVVDRNSVAIVRQFLDREYPDEKSRLRCLERLVDSIKVAHSVSPRSWTTRMRLRKGNPRLIRLNTGRPQVLVLEHGEIELLADENEITESVKAKIGDESSILVKWDSGSYKSVPTAIHYSIGASSLDRGISLLSEAHESLLRKAASSVPSSPYQRAHWPAILRYLREEGFEVPDPDWYIPSPSKQNIWLFQANASRFALANHLRSVHLGQVEKWTVTSRGKDMDPGETVLLWQSAPDAGIYAMGVLVDKPTLGPPDIYARTEAEETLSVHFEYTHVFSEPILKAELVQDPVLKQMHVVGFPGATNYEIKSGEWSKLQQIIAKRPNVILKESPVPSDVDMATATNLALSEVTELQHLLEDKRQIILEGPPGSGKTFVADKLARFLTGNQLSGDHDDHIEIVQFHQSYGYEDFVQGIRPATAEGGGLTYNVQPGIFLKLCQRARTNPDEKFVLIIDEINRGNISRVFGELLMLLEYRDKKIRLPYGPCEGFEDGQLSIPDNLLIIGTMNSTDRSLAVIDYALRRRFYFYRLMPVVNGKAAALSSWLAQQEFTPTERDDIHNLFVALNDALRTHGLPEDFQIGHSYFMRADIHTEAGRKRVWQWAITPLIREYFHNARDDTTLNAFTIARLLQIEAATLASDAE